MNSKISRVSFPPGFPKVKRLAAYARVSVDTDNMV